MRILVLGGAGLTGSKVVSEASRKGYEVYATYRNTPPPPSSKAVWIRTDVDEPESIRKLLDEVKPDAVIDMHAFNKVDDCEDVGKEQCWKTNAVSPGLWAKECSRRGVKYLTVSTDFVFDGENPPYSEDSIPRPLSQYAVSKLVGEQRALLEGAIVLRTAVVYDADKRSKFPGWVIRNVMEGKRIGVFVDQWNNPTLARDLAHASILAIEELKGPILLHAVGRECASRYSFAMEIVRVLGLDEDLLEATCSCRVNQKAKRPHKACLKTTKIEDVLGFVPRGYREALRDVSSELKEVWMS
ncbi:hypothetical protein EYM_06245 [Ignicoccus islandicus DSM 13165]|uniref:RmlD-like substrate binding domain-containing protein n=1 Tax=Ignicoccus islandicus DSM 13165 TaxID=940295 RepID=A0A0U3G380_9CREN|nr:SDR family oxidoreductase [Ignicoccus islandicus]ALU12668.1 hypothetical protein EYM_06245 [Ignicoccus islandicus DSM 13165]